MDRKEVEARCGGVHLWPQLLGTLRQEDHLKDLEAFLGIIVRPSFQKQQGWSGGACL
jgi:hypothetical protein